MPVQAIVIGLEAFQVAFLLLHDWIPLGSLNDVRAVAAEDSVGKRVWTTLLSALPFVLTLYFSVRTAGAPWPGWVHQWLWICYGLLFVGQLRAWWVPYLGGGSPARAERYGRMFGRTHAFLPRRNGIVPNTLHVLLHVATLATLVLLIWT